MTPRNAKPTQAEQRRLIKAESGDNLAEEADDEEVRTVVERLRANPQFLEKVFKDSKVRAAFARTDAKEARQSAASKERRTRELIPNYDYTRAYHFIVEMKLRGKKAQKLLQGMPPLNNDQRGALREELEQIEIITGWLRKFTSLDRPEGLADEVHHFLANPDT